MRIHFSTAMTQCRRPRRAEGEGDLGEEAGRAVGSNALNSKPAKRRGNVPLTVEDVAGTKVRALGSFADATSIATASLSTDICIYSPFTSMACPCNAA